MLTWRMFFADTLPVSCSGPRVARFSPGLASCSNSQLSTFGDRLWAVPSPARTPSQSGNLPRMNTCRKMGGGWPDSGAYRRFDASGFDEAPAAALRAKCHGNCQDHDGEDLEAGQRPTVSDAVAQAIFRHGGA